jgi:hypothetical protein
MVPRFYFDIRAGGRLVPHDGGEDGFEFADIDAAEREAALTAAEIARDTLPGNHAAGEVKVEVRDAEGRRVLTVTMSMQIHRDSGTPPRRRRPF